MHDFVSVVVIVVLCVHLKISFIVLPGPTEKYGILQSHTMKNVRFSAFGVFIFCLFFVVMWTNIGVVGVVIQRMAVNVFQK